MEPSTSSKADNNGQVTEAEVNVKQRKHNESLDCQLDEANEKHQQLQKLKQSLECPLVELPAEVLLNIFSYFDIKTLGRLAVLCKRFKSVAYDPSLYTSVDLSTFSRPNINAGLGPLSVRCRRLRELKVGCSYGERIDLRRLMSRHQSKLTKLDHYGLNIILPDLSNLVELSLSYTQIDEDSGSVLQCRHLKHLHLTSVHLNQIDLYNVLKNNTGLERLEISKCDSLINMDTAMAALVDSQSTLKVLHLDDLPALTEMSVGFIQELKHLECLTLIDILSCRGLADTFKSCMQLTRLSIISCRGLTFDHLADLADHCSKILSLTILFNNINIGFTLQYLCGFVANFPELEVFSLASPMSNEDISMLTNLYPNIYFTIIEHEEDPSW